jgi:Zn-dependent protease
MPTVDRHRAPQTGRPGLALRLDISWLPAALILVWWSGNTALPERLPEAGLLTHWLLAVGLVLGLFVSVVSHEIVRLLVIARYGGWPTMVRLYPFGGLHQRESGTGGPEGEFMSAVSGPATSLLIAFALMLGSSALAPGSTTVVPLGYLAALNFAIGLLNLVPAFPLDAGRALRSVLWTLRSDFGWATTVSVRLGTAFGLFLIAVGIFLILGSGAPVAGLTTLLVGFTIRGAATTSYRHLLTRLSLGSVPVSRLMDENPITVQRALSVASLVDDFIYKHQLKMLPVVDGERLLGYVTAQHVKQVPRAEWPRQSIGTITVPFSPEVTVEPGTAALEALDKMTRTGLTRLMVVDEDRLAGTIALQDLLRTLRTTSAREAESS